MHRFPVLITAVLALSLGLPVAAGEPERYVAAGMIAGLSDVGDFEVSGTMGPARLLMDEDWVAGIGAGVGSDWGRIRAELGYLLRYRFDFDVRPRPNAGGAPVTFKSDVQSHGLMLRVLWDFEAGFGLTPYVGGGLGALYTDVRTERRDSGTATSTIATDSDLEPAWAVAAGVVIPAGGRWSLDLGYQYTDLGDIPGGRFAGGERLTGSGYRSHDFRATAQYRF